MGFSGERGFSPGAGIEKPRSPMNFFIENRGFSARRMLLSAAPTGLKTSIFHPIAKFVNAKVTG
jgi:hypothetical protein